MWKQTPEFNDTFVTYAYYAGHAVNMVSVENFDYFLNCLCEPSQKDLQIIEVLFLYTFYFASSYSYVRKIRSVPYLTFAGKIGT